MGSIRFVINGQELGTDCVEGYPNGLVKYEVGADPYDRGLDTIRRKQVPAELELVFRAMQIVTPPEAVFVGGIGMRVPDPLTDAIFGVGRRSAASLTMLPTELVAHAHRAWVMLKEWTEGGGDGWIGPVAEHRAFVAGLWLNETAAQQWAAELAEHPLGKFLLEGSKAPFAVVLKERANPAEWAGVEVTSTSHRLLTEEDDYLLKTLGGGCPVGVYHSRSVTFGRWSGTVYVHAPGIWKVEQDGRYEGSLTPHYPLLCARNGQEEVRLIATEADREPCGNLRTSYTTDLTGWRRFEPIDASGTWATFWPSREAWEAFAGEHQLRAQSVFALHGPDFWFGGGECFAPLNREWAEKAWVIGATQLPAESNPLAVADFNADGQHGWRRLDNPGSPLNGANLTKDGRTVFLADRSPRYKGWIRAQPGIGVSHAAVVRQAGDSSRERSELTVFTDGSCVYAPAVG